MPVHRIAALTALVVSLSATPALAATASESSGVITYTAAAGETNVITVDHSSSNNDLTITDSGTATHGVSAPCVLISGVTHCPDVGVPSLTIIAADGNDTITINPGVNGHLSGLDVNGGAGDDQMSNSSSVPGTLDYSGSNTGVTVDLGAGIASSAPTGDAPTGLPGENFFGFENVVGSTFADTLVGDGNANVIQARGGADTLAGGAGDDTLDGGTGNDTATYSFIVGTSYPGADTVTANLITGTAQGSDGTDQLVGVENLTGSGGDDTVTPFFNATVQGMGGDDTIIITPSAENTDIDGGSGNDTLEYTGFGEGVNVNLTTQLDGFTNFIHSNTIERVIGTPFADTLTGDASAQELDGAGGNDTLNGGGGNDILDGGAGRDTASFATSASAITASLAAGTATGNGIVTLTDIENLAGSPQADTLIGDSANNTIGGGGGDDTIQGRAGDDILNGGPGTNTVSYADSSSPVFVDLPNGTATGDGADSLNGFTNVIGSNWDDTIHSRDTLAGTIDCGNGTDTAVVDATDTVNANCETVDNGTPPPPPPPTPTVTVTAPAPPPTTVTVTVTTPPPTPPTVTITAHPATTVKAHGATAHVSFSFTSSTHGATFKCALDTASFASCRSPKSYSARAGRHTFSVEAVANGLTGPAKSARFTVRKSR
jgi:Ca2+-binding RTX toxin-like protein